MQRKTPHLQQKKLPVDDLVPKILRTLENQSCVVIQASPGTGKTSRVPPALMRPEGEVLVLEPRRVAAKFAAKRVAEELGIRVGEEVGYQFRFENVTSAKTRLKFLTEGMLMRHLISDPKLRRVHTVILDEFHERHLHGDIALAYLRKLQLSERPDLRLVVMSATLDSDSISRYLDHAPILRVEAPLHPVEVKYLSTAPTQSLERLVVDATTEALEGDSGHILVFLPGMSEIRRCAERLQDLAKVHNILITPLHGELNREEQDLAIEPSLQRKIILATNVAETSLTIDGVRSVIDSGLHRVATYSWWSGVPTLKTRPISRASAIQRAGRAGRTGPGKCIRLYTRGSFDGWAAFQTPEIQRADLTQTVLELKSLGLPKPSELPWFEPPSPKSLQAAEELLHRLGAIEEKQGQLTDLGQKLVQVPAHPRIAQFLFSASRLGVAPSEASLLAALISEGELQDLDALGGFPRVNVPNSARRLSELLKNSAKLQNTSFGKQQPTSHALAKAILSAFPDRVARYKADSGELLFSEGGSTKIPPSNFFHEGEYFVLLDVQERQGLGQSKASIDVKSAVLIQPDWLLDLQPNYLEEREELVWDRERKRVQALSQLRYGKLILSERRSEPHDSKQASTLLAQEGLGLDLTRWLHSEDLHGALRALGRITEADQPECIEIWAARIELLRKLYPEIPAIRCPFLVECVLKALEPYSSLGEVEQLNWTSCLTEALAVHRPTLASDLNLLTPLTFQLPNGRCAPIHYKTGVDPWVESRLQDFFGVRSPPSILRGQVPLTLHLLAPNQRAVQVTKDLPGFWRNTYPRLRNELSRKYPRHSWPEDPSKAEAADSKLKPRKH